MIFSYNNGEGLLHHYLAVFKQVENYPLNVEDAIPNDITLGKEELSKTLDTMRQLYTDPSHSYEVRSFLFLKNYEL